MQHNKRNQLKPISGTTFGQRVRSARDRLGWTQQQLSDRLSSVGLKLDTSAITRIENDSRDPRLSEAEKIASALGVDVTALIPDEPSKLGIRVVWDEMNQAQWALVDAVYEYGLTRREFIAALDELATNGVEVDHYETMRLEASWRAIADWPAIRAHHERRVREDPPKDPAVFDAEA